MTFSEVAPGVARLVLPLGVRGVATVNAYLIADDLGDTLVDCGVPARSPGPRENGDGIGVLAAALDKRGGSLERLSRLVVTHAHVDHFGLAGEVVRRSGADLWMHAATRLDLASYDDPSGSVDRLALMLAEHGLSGDALTEAAGGLRDWRRLMPSIGRVTTVVHGGERFAAGGRTWEVVHTPGHSPGHVCLWSVQDSVLCSGDHLLKPISPPVTFERGFDPDPMGSYLVSLRRVQELAPSLVLPGHGEVFRDGARRAAVIGKGKRRRLEQVHAVVAASPMTVAELTSHVFPGHLDGHQLYFAMTEVLAYLAHHEVRGRVERVREGAVFVWRAVPTK